MSSVHSEVLALLRQWRLDLDAAELTMPIDLPALQARQEFEAARFPSVAHAIEQVRATVLRGTAFPPLEKVVAQVTATTPVAGTNPSPHPPAWIPDELYPYPTAS